MAKIDLSNPTKRNALKPRTSFYAHALGGKRYVLKRVGATGRVWGVRTPDQPDRTIGPVEGMTFDQVAALALSGDTAKPEAQRTICATKKLENEVIE